MKKRSVFTDGNRSDPARSFGEQHLVGTWLCHESHRGLKLSNLDSIPLGSELWEVNPSRGSLNDGCHDHNRGTADEVSPVLEYPPPSHRTLFSAEPRAGTKYPTKSSFGCKDAKELGSPITWLMRSISLRRWL